MNDNLLFESLSYNNDIVYICCILQKVEKILFFSGIYQTFLNIFPRKKYFGICCFGNHSIHPGTYFIP